MFCLRVRGRVRTRRVAWERSRPRPGAQVAVTVQETKGGVSHGGKFVRRNTRPSISTSRSLLKSRVSRRGPSKSSASYGTGVSGIVPSGFTRNAGGVSPVLSTSWSRPSIEPRRSCLFHGNDVALSRRRSQWTAPRWRLYSTRIHHSASPWCASSWSATKRCRCVGTVS